MKIKTILFIMILVSACTEEPTTTTIDFTQYDGIWVPYEIIAEDGTIAKGPFTSATIFGIYAESVQLKENKYVPVIWTDKENYYFKTEDGGNFEYQSNNTKLFLKDGSMDLEFNVIKYNNDELWLKYLGELFIFGGPQAQYKFKRELKN